jgi:hypothetical protein
MTTSEPGARPSAPETDHTLRRRGLLAVAAAFVAGLVAKLSEQPVSAGVDGDVVLGQGNTTAGITSIVNTSPNSFGFFAQCIAGAFSVGLTGQGSQYGLRGELITSGQPGAAVLGQGRLDSPGVRGANFGGGIGVHGTSGAGFAVLGEVPASSSQNNIAIYGQNFSTYAGPSPGAGGFAIYGLSAKGHGLVGATAATGAAAVVGATNGVPGAYAAAFYGPVNIAGNFTVVGGAKSAAVPHPDGSHRRLYCMESPESWFEDFGKGQLECGRAEVTIDPDFAAVVDLSDYHVFLTGYDTDNVLQVKRPTPTGFTVEINPTVAAMRGNTEADLAGTFSWRVVAKRKDITGERLAAVTVPPEPALPPRPDYARQPGKL